MEMIIDTRIKNRVCIKTTVEKIKFYSGCKLFLLQHTVVNMGKPVLKKIWAFFK
jgi:hypothetical protein